MLLDRCERVSNEDLSTISCGEKSEVTLSIFRTDPLDNGMIKCKWKQYCTIY